MYSIKPNNTLGGNVSFGLRWILEIKLSHHVAGMENGHQEKLQTIM
jgi:hypothetical protein